MRGCRGQPAKALHREFQQKCREQGEYRYAEFYDQYGRQRRTDQRAGRTARRDEAE
jgi:hypothetical protein